MTHIHTFTHVQPSCVADGINDRNGMVRTIRCPLKWAILGQKRTTCAPRRCPPCTHSTSHPETCLSWADTKFPIDREKLLQLRWEGKTVSEISRELGVSIPTLSRRIAELEHGERLPTRHRELHGLQLTMLQFRVLEANTPERIEKASITELVFSFYILKKAELAISGRDTPRIAGVL